MSLFSARLCLGMHAKARMPRLVHDIKSRLYALDVKCHAFCGVQAAAALSQDQADHGQKICSFCYSFYDCYVCIVQVAARMC